ncbi:hypothetical protein I7I48_10878 [Histoplasma ohiense]|nr:hypothetical protein I7I48_10878 [Histoplasma ohiense (nom. inval.)]
MHQENNRRRTEGARLIGEESQVPCTQSDTCAQGSRSKEDGKDPGCQNEYFMEHHAEAVGEGQRGAGI